MWWNNVETKPYGGYPQFYDVKITQLIEQVNPGGQVWNVRVGRKHHAPYGVFEGMTIFDAGAKVGQAAIGYIPTDQEWRFVNIYEDTATSMRALVEGIDKTGFSRDEPWKMTGSSLPEHETFFFYLQRICNHCTYPGCLAACPRKAIYKRPEDGIVLIDQNRCRGYKKCVEQCPFKKPMYRGTTRVSEKCIACYPRIEGKDPLTGGEPMETRCMAACVGKIRMQSLVRIGEDGLWAEDRWHPLYYAIRVEQVALPLYPQWGTEPNGFYIPPRPFSAGLRAADVRPGRGQRHREVPRAESGTVGGAAALARQSADHLPVRRDSGPEGVRNPDSREAVRDVQRYRAGLQQVGQGSGAAFRSKSRSTSGPQNGSPGCKIAAVERWESHSLSHRSLAVLIPSRKSSALRVEQAWFGRTRNLAVI
jgi:Fe-S-cluster-containing dehydrogenase component